ncbi:hypothetical protein KNP414_07770 [Paenibacillus mucilaginosus KNP414]|uniref:Uncharacterized protein n=1 Tax=Paenibacillus mucilaginosus (strain KNP414) TaxID=1036673 RepID=F8FGV5_PAEMK|nr:hypothetical protein KNP414_07770 [Paenibacillus mucilaginosus KNP414]
MGSVMVVIPSLLFVHTTIIGMGIIVKGYFYNKQYDRR